LYQKLIIPKNQRVIKMTKSEFSANIRRKKLENTVIAFQQIEVMLQIFSLHPTAKDYITIMLGTMEEDINLLKSNIEDV
jgi:hypothetical protein